MKTEDLRYVEVKINIVHITNKMLTHYLNAQKRLNQIIFKAYIVFIT